MIGLVLYVFGKNTTEVILFSVHHHIRGNMILLQGDVNLDSLVKVLSIGFLHCKVPNFPFIINDILAEIL